MPIIALAVMTAIVIPLTYGTDFEMLTGVEEIMEKTRQENGKIDFFKEKNTSIFTEKARKRTIAYKYKALFCCTSKCAVIQLLKGLLFHPLSSST